MSLARKDTDTGLRALVASTNIKPEQKVPQVLSKLQDILNRISVQDDGELGAFKNSLFSHGILQYCAGVALKLNYAKVEGGYATATQLAEILSSCCVGVDMGGDTEAFHRQLLPSVTDSLLSLASRLMNRALAGNGQPEMFRFFKKVMGSVCWLLKAHGHLATQVLQSDHYERMLMSEEERVGTVCVSLWHQLLTANSELVAGLGKGPLSVILDDVVYRMALTSNPVVGGAAIRTLLLVARQQESALQLIIHRFKGLEGMIGREWRGRGFDEDVDQLIKLLHREVPKPADHTETWPEECVRAACVIQAAWRSYQTRRRVKNLPRAVRSLQRSFRERRRRRVQQAQAVCWEEELRLQLCVRRQRARREFHQKQLQLLQLLPPGQVQQYLGEVERQAAIQIQRVWRGHRERRNFQQRRNTHTQHRAAVVLQRTVLRFLKRRRAEKAPPSLSPWNGPRGLTDSRRAELKREVEEHIALHPSSVVSLEGSRELHAQTQALLLQHLQGREAELREHTHTHALLAQINTDLELLLNAPSLSVATVTDCDVFRSRSAPVAARARQSHNALLQAGRLPWWKMLGDGDITCPESESAHKDHRLEAEFNSLYLGRS
ncbi:IQ calmodulin-binding motif-containing protein 1 isoform X1 [Oncorhynchus kisutch]|uniref:IQ calmodulin-binding motif-containing protein 1 isoform X1 n=1 Tax=Oncorhynchus kisutch TaxID=8019 RepID=UPI0012DE39E9|nr:IQ calmodulin-binding motif-containing protein 1 isoform X1 [Oncorhynchus kisutch]